MIRLTLVLGVVTLVLLACSASPTTTPPVLKELPPVQQEELADWDRAMERASIMRDHARQLASLVGSCEYEPKDAHPYVPCCADFLQEALVETGKGYAAILQYAALTEQVYQEAFGQPMTDEQRAEYLDYWTYTITSLQSLVKPTERMLRDFGCVQ